MPELTPEQVIDYRRRQVATSLLDVLAELSYAAGHAACVPDLKGLGVDTKLRAMVDEVKTMRSEVLREPSPPDGSDGS